LGNSGIRIGTRSAAGRLAEVCPPDVVVVLRICRAEAFVPDDLVGRIDDAVVVVVAGRKVDARICKRKARVARRTSKWMAAGCQLSLQARSGRNH
jgi:hypothetical protein